MTDIAAEYRIMAAGAGWTDRSGRGRLRFEGRDRASFLQGLLTNDVVALGPRDGAYAALLTPQGRMIADFRLYNRGEAILADVAPGLAAGLTDRFDALVFAEDVRVTDVSAATAAIAVAGGRAADAIALALEIDRKQVGALKALAQMDAGPDRFVVRSDEADVPIFDVWIAHADRDGLIARLAGAGAAEVSDHLFDALRIEAGRPAFGVDMTTETIPLEAGIEGRAISMTKGCYVGQEVIIRVLHRGGGRVAKRLVKLVLDHGPAGEPGRSGARIFKAGVDGAEAGKVTSAAFSPKAGRAVALGYVARDLAEIGAAIEIETPGGRVAGEIIGFAA